MVDELLFENYTDRFYPASDSGGPPIYLNPKVLEITDWLKTKMDGIDDNEDVEGPNKLSDSSALQTCLKMLQAEGSFYDLTDSYPNLPETGRQFKDFILKEFDYKVKWVGGGRTSDKVFEKVSLLRNFYEPINSALVQTHQYKFRRYSTSENNLWMLTDINSDWAFAPNLFVLKPTFTLPSFMNWNMAPF